MPGVLGKQLEELAEEVFELSKMSWSAQMHARRRTDPDISEYEFLTLEALARDEPLTVGELQRRIGVLPAQMSRVIRSLENKPDAALVACAINAQDKRKVDVSLTDAGRKAVASYRAVKLDTITEALACLGENDRTEFIRILRLIRRQFNEENQIGREMAG